MAQHPSMEQKNARAERSHALGSCSPLRAPPPQLPPCPRGLRLLDRAGVVATIAAMGCKVESAWPMQVHGPDDWQRCKAKQPGVDRDGDTWCTWLRIAPTRD